MAQSRDAPAYQEYPANFMARIQYRVMSLAERGLLLTLRHECWVNKQVPADPRTLARMLGYEVNEVFFEDVRVPADQLVGQENQGWTYAKFLLGNERTGITGVGRTKVRLALVKEQAGRTKLGSGTLLDDPDSVLKSVVQFPGGSPTLTWPGVTGRTYAVVYATNIVDATFRVLDTHSNIPCLAPGDMTIDLPDLPDSIQYFGIQVRK